MRGLVCAAGLTAGLLAGVLPAPVRVGAQTVAFYPPEAGNRRVTLRWNPAPGDTLDARIRRSCLDSLLVRCTKPAFCAWCGERNFGGYQIWRSTSPDPGSMVLLRTYSVFDSTWQFDGPDRVFVDPDSIIVRGCAGIPDPFLPCDPLRGTAIAPFNGFPYYYAVTWFDSRAVAISGGVRIEEVEVQDRAAGAAPEPVRPSAPAVTASPLLAQVAVVPNPFNLRDAFRRSSFAGESRVQFINLPGGASINIYSVAGDLVRTLDNDEEDGSTDWDLKNGDGDDVVGGIYLYVVSAAGGTQTRSGHFVIIR